jgi:glycosyltransferase involved in cell wall biosynthesis
MPAVGVVMPTHGAGRFLGAAVESVLAQSFGDLVLCVVCDGASEPSASMAAGLAARDRRVRVVRQPRAGVAAARNRGLAELEGADVALVAFLDHDDRWLPQTLATLVRAIGDGPGERVGAHGLGRYIDEEGALVRPGEMEADLRRRRGVSGRGLADWPPARPTGFANLAFSCCIPVGSVLVRHAALRRVGPFDERAVPADDHDMWLRLARLGDFTFVDEVVMEYRQHAAPTWTRPRGPGLGAPYMRRKAITSPLNTPAQAAAARRGYRLCERLNVEIAFAQAAEAAAGRRFRVVLRRLARAGLHLGSYLRGRPGPWHR